MSLINKITVGTTNYNIADSAYYTCGTAAATANKSIEGLSTSEIVDGMSIRVKFTYSNTASNPKLYVGSTGYTIYRYGTTAPGTTTSTSWLANEIVEFTFVASGTTFVAMMTKGSSSNFSGSYNDLTNKPTIPATNVIPATTTANKVLLSTTTSGTAKWSDFSTAGLLRTTASGVISVDSNSYVTYSTTTIGSDTALYLNAQNHLRVYEDSARIFVPQTEFVDDIDAIYGAYGIQLIDYDDDESKINIKFPFTKSPGTYTMATLEDIPSSSGTVTSVAIANDTNGGLTVSSGSPITTSGTIKLKHSNVLSSSGTIGSSSASSGATLAVPYANYDINGHITSKGTHTHTINNLTSSAINSGYKLPTTTEWAGKQDADADLTAIAALTGTSGFLKKTAANTWALDTNSYLTTGGIAYDSNDNLSVSVDMYMNDWAIYDIYEMSFSQGESIGSDMELNYNGVSAYFQNVGASNNDFDFDNVTIDNINYPRLEYSRNNKWTTFDFRPTGIYKDDVNITYNPSKLCTKTKPVKSYTRDWLAKTWTGLTTITGAYIWTDGENIYYSGGTAATQYVLDRSTSTWKTKTWSGSTTIRGDNIWTDGENIYYSNTVSGDGQTGNYILNKSTSTWSTKTWSGYTSLIGKYIWTDGEHIYYSNGTTHYRLTVSTSTWSSKTWTGLTNFTGDKVWTCGKYIYYSNGNTGSYSGHYCLDTYGANSNEWTSIGNYAFGGNYSNFTGDNVWSDGDNIYAGEYILRSGTKGETVNWTGITPSTGKNIWTDGTNVYYSGGTAATQYVLCKQNSPKFNSNELYHHCTRVSQSSFGIIYIHWWSATHSAPWYGMDISDLWDILPEENDGARGNVIATGYIKDGNRCSPVLSVYRVHESDEDYDYYYLCAEYVYISTTSSQSTNVRRIDISSGTFYVTDTIVRPLN